MRERLRRGLLIGIGALYLLSVPWYRQTGSAVTFVWGLPDWVAWALGCYVGVAVLNCAAWLLTDIPEAASGPREPSAGSVSDETRDRHP